MCNFSPKFANHIVSSKTNIKVHILSELNCLSRNVLYYISCTKSERLVRPISLNILVKQLDLFVKDFMGINTVNEKVSTYKCWQTFF